MAPGSTRRRSIRPFRAKSAWSVPGSAIITSCGRRNSERNCLSCKCGASVSPRPSAMVRACAHTWSHQGYNSIPAARARSRTRRASRSAAPNSKAKKSFAEFRSRQSRSAAASQRWTQVPTARGQLSVPSGHGDAPTISSSQTVAGWFHASSHLLHESWIGWAAVARRQTRKARTAAWDPAARRRRSVSPRWPCTRRPVGFVTIKEIRACGTMPRSRSPGSETSPRRAPGPFWPDRRG